MPYFHEALDGHTTINWAGTAAWSNGNVALAGMSYLGSCAWLAAQFDNPHLRTIIPMFTTQDTYSIWMGSGMPFLKGPLFWLCKYGEKHQNDAITPAEIESILWKLPVSELDVFTVNRQIPFYREYLAHPLPDQFWKTISVDHQIDKLDIPALIVGGWYDPFLNGTIEDYQRIKNTPLLKNQFSELLIGPWAHNPTQEFTKISFGKKASLNILLDACLQWCDHWLKQNIPAPGPKNKVRYFIMGKNDWREAQQWPPENVVEEKYFLSGEGEANDLKNNRLSQTLSHHTYQRRYLYNPLDPVLFRGEYLLYGDGWIAPIEQDEILARNDVLIYTSEPLKEELVIAGSPKITMYVSSTAPDTDFCVKLCDVHPDGKTYNLTSGFLRMRYRDSLKNPEMMENGTIYRIEIPFRPIANAFFKNHCIQLQVTSSDFPVHNRNLNTGMSCEHSTRMKEAEQTLYFGGVYDAYLSLPILRESNDQT